MITIRVSLTSFVHWWRSRREIPDRTAWTVSRARRALPARTVPTENRALRVLRGRKETTEPA